MKWIKVFSPATIGNIGPGFDVLGLAVKKWGDIVEARKITSGIKIKSIESEVKIPTNPDKNTVGIAAKEVLKMLKVKGGVEFIITDQSSTVSGFRSKRASIAVWTIPSGIFPISFFLILCT